MRYAVVNFAYGRGPYLRTVELALALNAAREGRRQERLGIIVPWVYGEDQRRVMLEEFAQHDIKHPGEILLDATLGAILKRVFYGESDYETALKSFVTEGADASRDAQMYLAGQLAVQNLSGESNAVPGSDIVLQLARSPRVDFGISPRYDVTFAHISEILEHVLGESSEMVKVDRNLVREAIPMLRVLEEKAKFVGLAEPGTFSYLEGRMRRYRTERAIPPTITPPAPNDDPLDVGIFVTVTGIPGLERLFQEAKALGMHLYTNDPDAVPGGERMLPHVVPNPAILFQFARAGWGSVWLSQLSGTPLVVPDFDPADDPEILYNNRCIEVLGLGIVWRGESLQELISDSDALRPGIRARNEELRRRFGMLDGNRYAAAIIANSAGHASVGMIPVEKRRGGS
ncbi:hypothetical protein C4552_02780 [Candidatus Parcubacteria bacterium]|nr:MAG: hypothetical protein C4552_02780 [Candidatus Parcubacteria bacterium]